MNPANIRVPDIIANLKVFPGGHRKLKRFDPRIKTLWQILVNHSDKDTFILVLVVSSIAETLGVDRRTVRRWLNWMEQHQLLEMKNRHGGRGCGIRIHITWLKRGQELAIQREKALAYKQEQNSKNRETGTQRQTTLHPTGGFNKNRACRRARMALTTTISQKRFLQPAVDTLCKWIHAENPTPELVDKVLSALEATEKISVPRIIRTEDHVFSWFRGLIKKLIQFGQSWWERFQRKVESRKLENSISIIKQAVDGQKRCPICKKVHSIWDWEDGRNKKGQLNCAGWARVKLEDLREAAWLERKEKRRERPQLSVQERWKEWREEQEREKISKRKQAKMMQEPLQNRLIH